MSGAEPDHQRACAGETVRLAGDGGDRPRGDAPAPGPYLMRALIAGVVLGVPVGFLLAYLAVMPFLLGLFFFLVFGLMLGAIMYRLARPAAPIPRERLTPISVAVVLVIWSSVLVTEYRLLPARGGETAVKGSVLQGLSREQIEQVAEKGREAVRRQLRERYWPGSVVGYMRWAVTSGEMPIPVVDAGRSVAASQPAPTVMKNVQGRVAWTVRVLASLALLLFAVDSQVSGLAPKPSSENETTEEAG